MIKSFGNKIKVAVFISGRGTNLKSLYYFSKKKNSKFQICIVISNKKYAKGLFFAKKNKIKSKIFTFKNRLKDELKVLKTLKRKNIKIICLAGFMKILSKEFIKKFRGKIINIHPSLLPKYKGLNTHERVLKNNERFSGCTVHYVNSSLDSGKIILQKKVLISKKDTPSTLKKKILKQEHILYPKAINKLLANL